MRLLVVYLGRSKETRKLILSKVRWKCRMGGGGGRWDEYMFRLRCSETQDECRGERMWEWWISYVGDDEDKPDVGMAGQVQGQRGMLMRSPEVERQGRSSVNR